MGDATRPLDLVDLTLRDAESGLTLPAATDDRVTRLLVAALCVDAVSADCLRVADFTFDDAL